MNGEIESSSVFNQLLKNQVIYVVDKDFNIVFASKGAIKLFEELNQTSESPVGTKCYVSFRRRDTKCKDCELGYLFNSENDDSYILPDRVCKRYEKDGEVYIIHYLFDSKLSDWAGEQEQLRKTVLEHIAHLTRSPIAEAITNLSLFSNEETLGRMSRSEFIKGMRLVKNALLQANITIGNLIIWYNNSSKMDSTPAQSIRVKEIISKIIRSFEVLVTNVRFKVYVNNSDFISLSTAEQIKLEIILHNVFHNSFKYSRPYTHYVLINISGKVSDGKYNIEVRDQGMGMSKEDLNNVWKEFYKGDSSEYGRDKYGSVRGLGMGLALVKKISTETGWRPNLYSKMGDGTTFVLEIPMRRSEYE